MRFPKLTWTEASHEKWTHGSPVTAESATSWHFEETFAYAPAWPICVREDLDPDVYLELNGNRKAVEVLLVSLSARLDDQADAVRSVIVGLRARSVAPLIAAEKVRPFVFQSGHQGLFREVATILHEEAPSPESHAPAWWTLANLNAIAARRDAATRTESGSWREL